MAIDLSTLAPITTTATALSNLVLVTPTQVVGYQPQNDFTYSYQTQQSLPTLVFDYEGEQTVTCQSDITDHFIEDNTAIQDQIALRPEIITTHGFIGELNDIAPAALKTAKLVSEKLTIIDAYTPVLSTTALIAYNEAFQAYQVANNAKNAAVSAWATITGGSGDTIVGNSGIKPSQIQNRQQKMFQQFYAYWQNRQFFTVQTPWAVFQNMVIMNLRAIQDETTRVITDFEVSFKRIRLASTATITQQEAIQYQGRLNQQASSLQNNGTVPAAPSISLTQGLQQGINQGLGL